MAETRMSKGEEAFTKAFVEAHNAVAEKAGRVAKALDPATISLIFGFIIEGLKICFNRNGEQETMARIREGGGLSQREVYRALIKGGYGDDGTNRDQRKKCKATAYELAGQGQKVTAEELEAFMADAKASNVPADSGDTGGFWGFGIALIACLLFTGSASASEGFWDAEKDIAEIKATSTDTNEDVEKLTAEVAELKSSIARIEAALIPAETPAPEPVKQKVATAASGITFRGQPIVVADFLARWNPSGSQSPGIIGSVTAHLREHGFGGNLNSVSRTTQMQLHSAAHRGARPTASAATATVSRSVAAPVNVGCANGQCALPSPSYGGQTRRGKAFAGYRTGIFGGIRPVFK